MSEIHNLADTLNDFKDGDFLVVDVETAPASGVWVTKKLSKLNLFEMAGLMIRIPVLSGALKTLNTSPPVLVVAPGVGFFVNCTWAAFRLVFNTTAYGAFTALQIKNDGAADIQQGKDGYLAATADSFVRLLGVQTAIAGEQYKENAALILTSDGDATLGDSDGFLYYKYEINTY